MARRKDSTRGYKLVALIIGVMLWAVAHGSSSVQEPFDVPVVFQNVPEDLVITEQNSDVINIRVQGSRAALRNLQGERLQYAVNVAGARRGTADYDVPQQPIATPRGAEVVSRSPSRLEVKFEPRGTKTMKVRAELAGEPAAGYRVAGVELEPAQVKVTGARREVLRLDEAVTEPIDVSGASASLEREVRLNLGAQNVWVEQPAAVRARVRIEPVPPPEGEGGPAPNPRGGAAR